VAAGPQELAPFGFNRTIAAKGKAIAGDFATIVQHPGGQKKQVALHHASVPAPDHPELGRVVSSAAGSATEGASPTPAAPASVDRAGSLTSVTVPCSSPSGWGTSLGARP
jgi:hypothetical protein